MRLTLPEGRARASLLMAAPWLFFLALILLWEEPPPQGPPLTMG